MKYDLMADQSFTHCLRLQIAPTSYSEERILSCLSFCLKYEIKNVILMFNAEELFKGYLTKEELIPWVDVIKKAKKVLNDNDISVSLNPWIEIGHLDRGRKLKDGQKFTNMVDYFGNKTELVSCPLDSNWQNYYLDTLAFYIKEIAPEVLWIEDDFRLHNHAPLMLGGCFCEHHMKLYEEKIGYKTNREEFVKNILKGPGKERDAFLDVSWFTMDELAKKINKVVKEVSPNTFIGLMSSAPSMHAIENRNWSKLHNDLCTNDTNIDRIHLPVYQEMVSPKIYLYNFNSISMVNRSFLGDNCLIYPELECATMNHFSKSPRFLQYHLETAIPLGLAGMTYDIFDFSGNGCEEDLSYGQAIKELTPYLNKIKSLNLLPSQMRGIVFPMFEDTVKNRITNESVFSLIPDDYDAASYFSALGYSYRILNKKEFHNSTVAIIGQTINNFSNEELMMLFKDNFIILDGAAANYLVSHNLGHLINATTSKFIPTDCGIASYETLRMPLNNIHEYKATLEMMNNGLFLIEYENNIEVLSDIYNYSNEIVGNGLAVGKNFMILPYCIKMLSYPLFSYARDKLIDECSSNFIGEYVKSSHQGISSYLYNQGNRNVVILNNSNLDNYDSIKLRVSFDFRNIKLIKRNGEIISPKFILNNKEVVIDYPFEGLTTSTLIFER